MISLGFLLLSLYTGLLTFTDIFIALPFHFIRDDTVQTRFRQHPLFIAKLVISFVHTHIATILCRPGFVSKTHHLFHLPLTYDDDTVQTRFRQHYSFTRHDLFLYRDVDVNVHLDVYRYDKS